MTPKFSYQIFITGVYPKELNSFYSTLFFNINIKELKHYKKHYYFIIYYLFEEIKIKIIIIIKNNNQIFNIYNIIYYKYKQINRINVSKSFFFFIIYLFFY